MYRDPDGGLYLDFSQALRTEFKEEGGKPLQRPLAQHRVQLDEIDAAGWSDLRVAEAVREIARTPFDLEASAVLRVKDQTLKSRLHRGRLILRKQLADFAGGLTLHRPIYGLS